MHYVRIVTNVASIRSGGRGPDSGEIWLDFGVGSFPAVCWNDFVVVVLRRMASSLVRIVRGVSLGETVHFMEGPYLMELVRSKAGRLLTVRGMNDGAGRAALVSEVDLAFFAADLIAHADGVLDSCRRRNRWTVDADELLAAVDSLKREQSLLYA